MKTHELKIMPEYYEAVVSGKKTFEIRYNDRDYNVGDLLILQECKKENDQEHYTGRCELAIVTYILDEQTSLREGYIAMGIKLINE